MSRPLYLATAILAVAFAKDASAQEVQIPMPPLQPLAGLEWRLPAKFATLDGDRLVIDIPAEAGPSDAYATAELPRSLLDGAGGFAMGVMAEGKGISKPSRPYLGLKFQLHWLESASGRDGYPNCANETGGFARKELRNEADFGGSHPDTATLMLGLQGTSGHVEFDLATLRAAPTQGLFRRVNENWVVRYPDKPDIANEGAPQGGAIKGAPAAQMTEDNSFAGNAGTLNLPATPAHLISAERTLHCMRPLRGCMLPGRPTTEDDIETLRSWGATMARFQITRKWSAVGDNSDLDEFAAWVDSRLDNLEDVLRWAGARGMKICVDLHVTPGGRDGAREHAMFRDERLADAFVETWRRIAARFSGHPALYGYDLVNEPVQHGRAPIDYWTLQRRAAEAVREIDPVTPIIIESNDWDSPDAFAYLSPLAMDNVIYQVHVYAPHAFTHQGVAKRPVSTPERPLVWPGESPDGGTVWDIGFLRRKLTPVLEFQRRHKCRIYVGEFSAAAWAPGAENYLRDCIALFGEFGWDWTYHAFRESPVWDVEKIGASIPDMIPAPADTPRKQALREGFRK